MWSNLKGLAYEVSMSGSEEARGEVQIVDTVDVSDLVPQSGKRQIEHSYILTAV